MRVGWLALAAFSVLTVLAPARAADDPVVRKGHFTIVHPAQLDKDKARATYATLALRMAKDYAMAGEPAVKGYQSWRRFNDAPYPSKAHGNRYLNNYANAVAAPTYGRMGGTMRMPEGAVIAKDSFTVTETGAVHPGALFFMEKLPAGTRPDRGDWRFGMILPDGSLFGDSQGTNADKVAFCYDCHMKRADETDHLYFFPEGNRRTYYSR
ncbi:MAG: cytochrome P460 family protein [Rhodobacterales bacterium]|nr:cytochrome P460 family protein [Rhodobacterales bacterium]